MHLTTFTDYGLRSLMYLAARRDRRCSVREIAAHFGISRNHLVKVVHRLAQLGYVDSIKGKGGGLLLAEHAGNVKLGQLVASLEPHLDLVECFNPETNTCRIIEGCLLKHRLRDAKKAFLADLDRHTLNDIAKSKALQV